MSVLGVGWLLSDSVVLLDNFWLCRQFSIFLFLPGGSLKKNDRVKRGQIQPSEENFLPLQLSENWVCSVAGRSSEICKQGRRKHTFLLGVKALRDPQKKLAERIRVTWVK